MNPKLTIDPEFEAKCPPLTEDELSQLEESIIEEGIVFTPIIVWNNTIVDGHNRYKIIQEHPEIKFRTHEKHFENRYEALSWICRNQLGRRNLTPMQKKYLIGERYDAEKMVHGGDRKSEDSKSSDKSGAVDKRQKIKQIRFCNRIRSQIVVCFCGDDCFESSFTIRLRLNAVAERRQCTDALPNPRVRTRFKLWFSF